MKRRSSKRKLNARRAVFMRSDRAWLGAAERAREGGYASDETVARHAARLGVSDETAYLMSSPANAAHLTESIRQARNGEAKVRPILSDLLAQSPENLPKLEDWDNMPPVGKEIID